MNQTLQLYRDKIENRALDGIIWLENNSNAARRIICQVYTLRTELPNRSFFVRVLFAVSMGFSLGLGLGMLAARLI